MKFFLVATCMLLVSCTPGYHQSHEEKLNHAASDDEKRRILATECSNLLRTSLDEPRHNALTHYEAMRRICGQMTGKEMDTITEQNKQ